MQSSMIIFPVCLSLFESRHARSCKVRNRPASPPLRFAAKSVCVHECRQVFFAGSSWRDAWSQNSHGAGRTLAGMRGGSRWNLWITAYCGRAQHLALGSIASRPHSSSSDKRKRSGRMLGLQQSHIDNQALQLCCHVSQYRGLCSFKKLVQKSA